MMLRDMLFAAPHADAPFALRRLHCCRAYIRWRLMPRRCFEDNACAVYAATALFFVDAYARAAGVSPARLLRSADE